MRAAAAPGREGRELLAGAPLCGDSVLQAFRCCSERCVRD